MRMTEFNRTYQKALAENDIQLQSELLIGEIAEIINTKPLTVIQTIEATTNKVFMGRTFGELTRAVGLLLKNNTRFASAMVTLCFLNNGIIDYTGITDAAYGNLSVLSSKIADQQYKNLSGGGADMISAAIGAVSNITGGSLQLAAAKAASKGATETAKLNLETAKEYADAQKGSAKEGTKQALLNALGAKMSSAGLTTKTILIIVGLLGVGVAGVYWLSRTTSVAPAIPVPSSPDAPPAPGPGPVNEKTPETATATMEIGGTPPIPPLDVKTS